MKSETAPKIAHARVALCVGEDSSHYRNNSNKTQEQQQVATNLPHNVHPLLAPFPPIAPTASAQAPISQGEDYDSRALITRNRARIAVAPWKAYQGNTLTLRADDLRRNTSAMIEKIQAADIIHTTAAPIHHNMSICLLTFVGSRRRRWNSPLQIYRDAVESH